MSLSLDEVRSFRPPAPLPRAEGVGWLSLLRTLWNNPLEAWTTSYFERPVVRTKVPFGDVIVVSDPGAIRRVLADNVANYRKDNFQKRMLAALSNGLLTAEDAQWQTQRRTMAPVFAARNIRDFAPAMAALAGELVERWRQRDGEVIDVAAEVTDFTLRVLERTIFSGGIPTTRHDAREAMRTYFDSLGRIDAFDLLDLPDFLPRVARRRADKAIRLIHDAVDEMIAERRRLFGDDLADAPQDILTLLMRTRDPQTGQGLTQPEIRANVMTFLAAGHETTANTITWTLFLLSQSSMWRDRVAAEAERELDGPPGERADRLVDTRAVVEETLRLYPPLAAISRVALGPDELAGVPLKRGAMVVIAPYVLHRHQILWKEPDLFDPARFLPDVRRQIDRYVYIPFGAGPRGCIGQVFALQEATLAVAGIVRSVRLEPAPGHEVWPVHRITLRPRNGLPMIVRALPASAAQCDGRSAGA